MISGIKISQLPVFPTLQDTDYFPVTRGITTGRASKLTLVNSLSVQNIGVGADLYAAANSGNGIISIKRLSAVSDYLTLTETTSSILLSSTIPTNSIIDTMVSSITGLGKVLPQAISTNGSLSGQVLISQGTGQPAIWKDVPMDASPNNISGKVVSRDLSGNFYATTVVAELCGNASTATKWLSSRAVTLVGPVYGTTTIDGTQNTTLNTTLSTGVISDIHLADNAGIADSKLNTISTPQKVSPNAIDYSGSQAGDVLTSLGYATVWTNPTALQINIPDSSITTNKIANLAITTDKIVDEIITTTKLSANSVTTSKIPDGAITNEKILDEAVTLNKTNATPAALSSSLVSRDIYGNLSATEIAADLKGNATTSLAWKEPMTLAVGGDILGVTTFDGSQTAVLSTTFANPAPKWAVFNTLEYTHISATYIQDDELAGPGNIVTVSLQVSTSQISAQTCTYNQYNNIIDLVVIPGLTQNNPDYLTYNLVPGTQLTATFTTGEAITGTFTPLSNETYIIQNITGDIGITTISLSTSLQQFISGEASFSYNETTVLPPHNHQTGHVISVEFLSGLSLDAYPYTQQVSGLYVVTDVIDPYTLTLSSTTFQYASGNINLYRTKVYSNFEVPVVSYVSPGVYVLNFQTPFETAFFYGYSGTVTSTSAVPQIKTIERDPADLQDQQNLLIRTYLHNGVTFEPFDFYRVNMFCYGY